MKYISLLHRRSLHDGSRKTSLVASDTDQPRKARSRHNDTGTHNVKLNKVFVNLYSALYANKPNALMRSLVMGSHSITCHPTEVILTLLLRLLSLLPVLSCSGNSIEPVSCQK